MQDWIGPAIVAAAIAGIINVLGWFVTYRQERQAEAARRKEKIRDCMTAIRAEIRCYNFIRTEADAEYVAAMRKQIEETADFTPFIPRKASNAVFATILPEIHILPGEVIDPIVRYYRQLETVAQSIEDMRSSAFEKLNGARKSAIYGDYIKLRLEGGRLAESAINAMEGVRDVR